MSYSLTKPVFFIGFMGAGKTSVSQYLATTCGLASIDADEFLELLEDKSIVQIFSEKGEDHFRDLETEYLADLARRSPRFIACGGGVVLRHENITLMREKGFVVYLQVTVEEAACRIPNTESRPLFKDFDSAKASLQARRSLYEQAAHACVQTSGRSIAEVASQVKSILEREGVLQKA